VVFFYRPCICMQALLDELVCLPLIAGGNNLESILFISPVADLWDPVFPPQGVGMQSYNSFSGCRTHSALHGGWATHSSALGIQTQQKGGGFTASCYLSCLDLPFGFPRQWLSLPFDGLGSVLLLLSWGPKQLSLTHVFHVFLGHT
jgi:hypothetical protein